MPRTWTPKKFTDAAGTHSSAIVALWLSADQADALAVAGGEPAEALHITLLCIGDANELTDVQIAHLLSTCDDIAAFTPPLAGEITGMGRFYANDANSGQDVVFAIPSLPEVVDLRERLENELGWSSTSALWGARPRGRRDNCPKSEGLWAFSHRGSALQQSP